MKKILIISAFIVSIALYSFTNLTKENSQEAIVPETTEATVFDNIELSDQSGLVMDFEMETE